VVVARVALDGGRDSADTAAMGVRTRGLDIAIAAKRQVADAAARAEAKAVIERWNEQLSASRDMLWSPTIRAALIAGTPWLDVFFPGCGTSRAIDLERSTAIPSPLSRPSCSGCGARGVQRRRRCRGSSVCMRSRLQRRPGRRICDLDAGPRRGSGMTFWMALSAR
jgi:hypothetical protein